MKKKMNFVSVIIIVLFIAIILIGCNGKVEKSEKAERNDDGQYSLGSKVQIYDSNFKQMDAHFTYFPGKPRNLNFDNAIILNRPPEDIFFGRINEKGYDTIGFVRSCIEKSIEWAETAKKNKVDSLVKEIANDEYDINDRTIISMFNKQSNSIEQLYLTCSFYIGDIDDNGKKGTFLIMALYDRNLTPKRYFCYSERDFTLLKEIFSDSYLAEIDMQEVAWRKSHDEQDALFE